jgi:A/G-specific adenine glycosylase
MLQQTRVETVVPYYARWMERFPTVAALAEADEESVLKAWEGLGYYARARNLHRSARMVREKLRGDLPTSASSLRTLPGIGAYSAGAIASIAYGEVVPAVDGNARRVLSRLFDEDGTSDALLRRRAVELLDPDRPGDWNQALMELGATVCLPRSPRCGECPLAGECGALAEGTQELRPARKRRAAVRTRVFAVLVGCRPSGDLLLVRRPREGPLGGMWEFPAAEIEAGEALEQDSLAHALTQGWRSVAEGMGVTLPTRGAYRCVLPEVRHAFTHLKAVYRPMLAMEVQDTAGSVATGPELGSRRAEQERRWVAPDQIDALPLPAAQRRMLVSALAEVESLADVAP